MEESNASLLLTRLLQIDINSFHAYSKALRYISDQTIRNQLNEFKEDHRQHVMDLCAFVHELGGFPRGYKAEFKRCNFDEPQTVSGVDGILRALHHQERLTMRGYDEAVGWDMSPEISNVLEENQEDEQAHNHYLEFVLLHHQQPHVQPSQSLLNSN